MISLERDDPCFSAYWFEEKTSDIRDVFCITDKYKKMYFKLNQTNSSLKSQNILLKMKLIVVPAYLGH